MASTNFKLFDENKTNMMSDTEYNVNTQRLNGVQAGIASSQLQNKTLYQTSLVAYSLAQIMMQNGYDANDSAVVSSFVGNLSNSLLQKVLDKATSVEAQNGVNNTKWMTPALTKAAIDILAAKSSNILSNETKTLYGLGTDAVPDDVLSKIKTLIDSANANANTKARIATGSYTGTGTYGDSNPCTLTCEFKPKLLIILPGKNSSGGVHVSTLVGIYGSDTGVVHFSNSGKRVVMTWSENVVSWYTFGANNAKEQMNEQGITYTFVVVG